ncbi:MAG: ABC transporter ATP-binding protein [Eubacteriales bacterium]|nr:ABC transporter ATP-binding protein [Eubacteriales bacterium]
MYAALSVPPKTVGGSKTVAAGAAVAFFGCSMTMTEKKKKQNSGGGTIPSGRLLLMFLDGSKRFFAVSMISSLVLSAIDLVNPQIIRFTVDTVIGKEKSALPGFANRIVDLIGGVPVLRERLWIIAAAITVFALLSAVFRYIQRLYNTKASETLVETVRNLLFAHIERLPFGWHMKNRTGDIIQRCTSDVDTVKEFLSEQLTAILQIVIKVVFSLAVMFSMNAKLALAATLTMPVILLYSAIFGRRIGKHFRECDENEGILSAMAQENLTGVRVVRAFGREEYERERFGKQNDHYTGLWVRLARLLSAFWGMGDFIAGTQALLIMTLGIVSCVKGGMTSGEFIAFVTYNAMLAWPIRRLGRMISEMSKAGISIDRLNYIMSSEEEKDRDGAGEPDMHGDIVFDDVSFAYEGCPELLSHISFTARAGKTVGILGGTGSGKSTLMYLLDRLYELPEDGSGGRITIGGTDIKDIKAAYLRKNIGIVLQEPYLFSRTIAENIGISRPDITMDEIREASAIACLDDTVTGFSEGYDTFVGERGVTLSGGQKQRAAIARMLTEKTPIMIFDDSLSAVDAETDAAIRAGLDRQLGGATVFLISHRTSTLMNSDLILVLDRGRIAEMGRHDELMAIDGGIYRRIYDIQTSSPDYEAENIGEEVTA